LFHRQVKRFDWLAKTNDITASGSVCGLRFSWGGEWVAVPRGAEGVSLLPRTTAWDQPPRPLACSRQGSGFKIFCPDWDL
jgi:hypothetical protein